MLVRKKKKEKKEKTIYRRREKKKQKEKKPLENILNIRTKKLKPKKQANMSEAVDIDPIISKLLEGGFKLLQFISLVLRKEKKILFYHISF